MPRITLTLPKKILKNLENEAERRILEMNMAGEIGRKRLGTIMKEIICISLIRELPRIKKMRLAEFEEEAEKLITK